MATQRPHDASKDYVERLVEAQLDGEPLPEPQTPEEERALHAFEQTDALMREVRTMRLRDDWQDSVWERIGREAHEAAAGLTADDADGSEARALAKTNERAGEVIDARHRFPWWPALAGVAAAASVLFMLTSGLFVGSDLAPSSEQEAVVAQNVAPGVAQSPRAFEGERASAEEAPKELAKLMPSADPSTGDLLMGGALDDEAGATGNLRERLERGPKGSASAAPADMPSSEAGLGGGGEGRAAAWQGGEFAEAEEKSVAMVAAPPAQRDALTLDPGHAGWDAMPDRDKRRGDGKADPKAPLEARVGGAADANRWNELPALTAGEVDDNRDFEAFGEFLRQRPKPHLEPMDVSERVFVRVLDARNKPMPNATVGFAAGGRSVFQGRTHADGWLLFHPRSVPGAVQQDRFEVTMQAGGVLERATLVRGSKERWEYRMPTQRALGTTKLDVVFLLDTTASMADEIERLQATIIRIAQEVSSLPQRPLVRFGLVVYRDDRDEYVSQIYPFTHDVNAFQATLASLRASGGGDIPERLEIGLHRTVHELAWDDTAAARMVFLVADAPPHGRSENTFSYSQDLQAAVGRGIKVFPVASSGLDDDGEYVFRQMAQYTRGRFVFLTYGANGTATPHAIKPGSFQPESLDQLVVRLVREELAGMETD